MIVVVVAAVILAVSSSTSTTYVEGFQWMSKFKMPTYDPQQDAVKEKFGDKSTSSPILIVMLFYACRDLTSQSL